MMMGANPKEGKMEFSVWAPLAGKVAVRLLRDDGRQDLPMEKRGDSFVLTAEGRPGDRYFYLVDDNPLQLPDPVSRLLPEGVHGPTEIVDPHAFCWTDQNWRGVEYRDYVIY